jgi:N-acetyltransferase 10
VSLLSYNFKSFTSALSLGILKDRKGSAAPVVASPLGALTVDEFRTHLTSFDMRRLDSYARNLVDYHMILDMVPVVCRLLFTERMMVHLSYTQQAILLGIGLQHKSVTELCDELGVSSVQILALFNKAVRKLSMHLKALEEQDAAKDIADPAQSKKKKRLPGAGAIKETVDRELSSAGQKATKEMRNKQKKMLHDLSLGQYEIRGNDADWDSATKSETGSISVKSQGKASKKKRISKGGKNRSSKKVKHSH